VQACGRLLVAPVNFNQRMPDEIEASVPGMEWELERYLEGRSCRFEVVPRKKFQKLWVEHASSVTSLYDEKGHEDPERYDRAVGLLMPSLLRDYGDFDALVIPYLAIRPAKLVGKAVYWDGVKRLLEDSERTQAAGVSVRTLVFSPDGVRLSDAYGGLEPLEVSEDGSRWIAPPHLLLERDHVHEGLREAFEPYLGS